MKKQIITDISFLRQKSTAIETYEEAENILKDLEDSLDTSRGIGLAGIQIGIPKKISLIKIGDKKTVLINSIIENKDCPTKLQQEGCLSIPGLHVVTRRYSIITLENWDMGKQEFIRFSVVGLEAYAVQHEMDHWQGRLITDNKWKAR